MKSSRIWRNWAGTVAVQPDYFAAPRSTEQICDLVRSASGCVRVVGSGHSFNRLIDTGSAPDSLLLSLHELNWVDVPCQESRTVRVGGGATYIDLTRALHGSGLALHNTAALPHVTVAGAVSTGTHGSSGVDATTGTAKLGSLASAVTALEIVCADGQVRELQRGKSPEFCGAVISMGCLGVISSVTLQLVPDYDVHQTVYGHWPLGSVGSGESRVAPPWAAATLAGTLREAMAESDSFSAFFDWPSGAGGMLVMRQFVDVGAPEPDVSTVPPQWHGAPLRVDPLPPLLDATGAAQPLRATSQGRWHDVLFWFMEQGQSFGPQAPEEVQFECFVPLRCAEAALAEVAAETCSWPKGLALYSEIRTVAADELWLAPSTVDGEDTLAIAFGMDKHHEAHAMVAFGRLERRLAAFGAKPHWGKLTTLSPSEVEERYARDHGGVGGGGLARFRQLCAEFDPNRKFLNEWGRRYVFDH